MISLMALSMLALGQDFPVVRSSPRQIADPWVQSVRATCGHDALEITGYGAGRPESREARVQVNDRPVTGPDAARLAADISSMAGVYRLQMLCPASGGFSVLINRGEAQIGGTVRYEVAHALIRDGVLVSYSEMETTDAESFWFR